MIELYNVKALEHMKDYKEIKVFFKSPVDLQVMLNFLSLFKDEDKIDRPISVMVALYNDYLKRGGDPHTWYKTTAENFTLAMRLMTNWSPRRGFWMIIKIYLSNGIEDSRDYKPVSKKVKDQVKEIAKKMKTGDYPNYFEDDRLKLSEILKKILREDYPNLKFQSVRTTIYNEYYSL